MIPAPDQVQLRLQHFDERFADVIVEWIQTEEQLHWLAPSTKPPLTAPKVAAWKKPEGQALVLVHGNGPAPIGYAELNPMRREPDHFWLGHVVLDPDRRGRGIGCDFVRMLLSYAFDQLCANRVSLIVFPDNEQALRCYLGSGFKLRGEERHRFGGNGPHHTLLRLEAKPG